MRQFTNTFVLSFLIPLLALSCASNPHASWQTIPQRNAGNLPPSAVIGLALANTNMHITVKAGPGKGAGAGKGALNAMGALGPVPSCGRGQDAALMMVLVAPIYVVAGVGGAIYGGVKAPSKKSQVAAAQQTINGIQRANAPQRVLSAIAAETRVQLGTNLVVFNVSGDSPSDLAAAYRDNHLSSVLELDSIKVGLTHEDAPEGQDRFFLEARSVLRDLTTGVAIHEMGWRYLGVARSYTYGGDAAAISETERLAKMLAQDLCEEVFLKALPEPPGEFYGVSAITPKQSSTTTAFWTNRSPMADSRQPTLKWAPYIPTPDVGEVLNLTYEPKVWQPGLPQYPPILIYHKEGLTDCEHRVTSMLAPDHWYTWTVRAHFTRNGRPAVSSWGQLRPFSKTHVGPGDRRPGPMREDLLYRFKTPKM